MMNIWSTKGIVLTFLSGVLLVLGLIFLLGGEKEEVLPISEEIPVSTESLEKDPFVVSRVVGTSHEGREIIAHTYGAGERRLLFVGGVHGGYEWNSILLAYEMMDYLTMNPAMLPEDVEVTIIPVLNPDGLFLATGVEGPFTTDEVQTAPSDGTGRFNARGVDLNRNFDCKWEAKSMWRGNVVSAGSQPFSEPEAAALRDYILSEIPTAVVFWHSQANAVYASECEDGVLSETLALMRTYADAAGYPSVESFDHYVVTGDAEGWLASIGIPAITVELATHETIEWERNKRGVEALITSYGK